MEIQGYRNVEETFRSERTLVFRAESIDGNRLVALKGVAPGSTDHTGRLRLQREFHLTSSLRLAGVVRPERMVSTSLGLMLEMPWVGSGDLRSLRSEVVPLKRVLEIGIRLATTVGELHDSDISHRDINPNNIMYHASSGEVWLIDFGLATRLARQSASVGPTSRLEGTLGYLSPEQTGRMNRSVDRRTDLYSLGATLYELATGRPPFLQGDALEVLHATVAVMPRAPSALRSDLPEVLSDIILCLLSKAAEDRYQSAHALADDLRRCLRSLLTIGQVDAFELSVSDRRGSFLIPEKLYGRSDAMATLREALQQAREGGSVAVGVSGPAGIGKTALSRELLPELAAGGLLVSGVCSQIDRMPYAPVLSILREIGATVLAGPKDQIEQHRQRMLDALDGQGAILARLLPEVAGIIGIQEPAPDLPGNEARERVLNMLVSLLRSHHTPDRPLVIFLDDLQWADPGSMAVIERLVIATADPAPDPLLVLAWRSDEVGPDHPLSVMIAQHPQRMEIIEPQPLRVEDVSDLVKDTLGCTPIEAQVLGERIHGKTAGNAFFVRQFLESLAEDGLLHYDGVSNRWVWGLDDIDAAAPTQNVAGLLSRRLVGLPLEAQELMGVAACIGKSFALPVLVSVYPKPIPDACRGLFAAVDAGLLSPEDNAWGDVRVWAADPATMKTPSCRFRFVHDTVHQAAYGLLEPEARQSVHLAIGRALWERSGEEKPFRVADQFNVALDEIREEDERLRVASLNLAAGRRAHLSAAFETAAHYLQMGAGLIREADWDTHYDLAFPLHLCAAESMLMCPHLEARIAYSAEGMARARNELDRVAMQRVKIRHHTGRYEFDQTLRLTLEALGWVGVHLPEEPGLARVALALLRTHWAVWGLDAERLEALPVNDDPRVEAAMNLLMDAAAPSYYLGTQLMPIILCRMVDLTVRHGISETSAFGCAGFAFIQIAVRDDVDAAVLWSEFARSLVQRLDGRKMAPKVELLALGFVGSRNQPLGSLIEPYQRASWMAREVGDAEYTALCAFNRSAFSFLSGVELSEVARRAEIDHQTCVDMGQERSVNALRCILQTVACLRGESPDAGELDGRFVDFTAMRARMTEGGDKAGVCTLLLHRARLKLLFGSDAEAVDAVEAVEGVLDDNPGSPEVHCFHFYAALVWIGHMRETGRVGGKPWRRARRGRSRLEKLSRHGPMTFKHRQVLVEAELEDLRGRTDEARRLYEEAIRLSRLSGILLDEAICLEWAGRAALRVERSRAAGSLLAEARLAWMGWGCTARLPVLAALDSRLGGSWRKAPSSLASSTHSTSTGPRDTLDFTSVMKASRAVSEEIHLATLLETLMRVILESGGADAGTLLLQLGGTLSIAATGRSGEGDEPMRIEVADLGAPLPREESLRARVVDLAQRSGEPVLIDDVSTDARFQTLEEARLLRSVLCVPALKGKKLVGIVYLENRLLAGGFTEERCEVVSVLCSQAAVSIDNAVLYGQLEEALETQKALTEAYGRFMPPQFLDLLDRDGILALELGDQALRQVTVLFADIRGFTRLAESMGPQQTFAFINRYLGYMEPAIHAHGGFVNQYLGDGIMALFPRSADSALRAALDMLEGLRRLNGELANEGQSPVVMGIGLNTGPLMLGAIGGSDRMGRGVVGDVTNVAARLESMTKHYDVPLLVGEQTIEALQDQLPCRVRAIDRVQPKGRDQPLTVYEVLEGSERAVREQKILSLEDYAEGYRLWTAGELVAARPHFLACVQRCPADRPAEIMAERCVGARSSSEPWTGVTRMQVK